jgi:hypothetical protein
LVPQKATACYTNKTSSPALHVERTRWFDIQNDSKIDSKAATSTCIRLNVFGQKCTSARSITPSATVQKALEKAEAQTENLQKSKIVRPFDPPLPENLG